MKLEFLEVPVAEMPSGLLPLTLWLLPALTGFTFNSPRALEYKTLITQEMLKKGYLAATSCYTCLAHTDDVVEEYLEALNGVFALIAECDAGRSVDELLEGPVCHGGFKRLN